MKSTKKSLLISILSITLCVAMLLGTTYAWFTDSVQSGVNQIVAGNLDVELLHTNAKVTNQTVEGETKLFVDKTGEAILWEPGVYSYETFTIKNVGNLALKYKMAINVASFTSYEGHNLTEVLRVKELDTAPTSRDDITDGELLNAWSHSSADVVLNPDAEKTFTVAIYWEPGENDNLYNMNNGRPQALSIDLGVSLVATQATVENDSFDEKYDKDAENTLLPVNPTEHAMSSAEAKSGQPTTFEVAAAPSTDTEGNKTKVEFSAGALNEGKYDLIVTTDDLLTSSNFTVVGENAVVPAETVASETPVAKVDLSLVDENGQPAFKVAADGKTAKVTTKIAKGLKNVGVVYSGTDTAPTITGVTYDSLTGILSFITNHFSDYCVTGDGEAYVVSNDMVYQKYAEGMANTAAKDTIILLKDAILNEKLVINGGKDLIMNLNEKTLTGRVNVDGVKLVVTNGTIDAGAFSQALNAYGSKDSKYTKDNLYTYIKVEKSATLLGEYGMCFLSNLNDYYSALSYGVKVDFYGTAKAFCASFISGNIGATSDSRNGTPMHDGVSNPEFNVYGTLIGVGEAGKEDSSQGISLNGYVNVNIYDGAFVSGAEAVGVKAGRLNVSGGTLEAKGPKYDPVEGINSGTDASGSAIAVTSTYSSGTGKMVVKVTGGKISSKNSSAILVDHAVNESGEALPFTNGVELNVNGAELSSGKDMQNIFVDAKIDGDSEIYPTSYIAE